jgi:hypothetical protein
MACFSCVNEFSWPERRSSRIFESEIVRLEHVPKKLLDFFDI